MLSLTPADYAGYAESRLTVARRRFEATVSQPYAERRGELAQVASLIWDATIDLVSALALLNGVGVSGRSSDMSDYAKRQLPRIYEEWQGPARLHNFQHKPDHPEAGFGQSCQSAGAALALLDAKLPAQLQLPAECWEWLTGI